MFLKALSFETVMDHSIVVFDGSQYFGLWFLGFMAQVSTVLQHMHSVGHSHLDSISTSRFSNKQDGLGWSK